MMKAMMLVVAMAFVLVGCGDGDGPPIYDDGAGGADGGVQAPDGNWGGPYDADGLILCTTVQAHEIVAVEECATPGLAVCPNAGGQPVVGCALVHTTTNHLVSCVTSCSN